MKVGIISFSVSHTSGAGRFAINLGMGLIKKGIDVSIYTYHIDVNLVNFFSSVGISCFFNKTVLSKLDKYRMINDSGKVALSLRKHIYSDVECDVYVVLNDKIIGISKYRNEKIWIYISQGDMLFLFFNKAFNDLHFPFSRVFSLQLAKRFTRHQNFAKNYDLVLANSNFTSELMSFMLDVSVAGVVYPPVDTCKFYPCKDNNLQEKYVVTLLRSEAEPSFKIVEKLAKTINIHVVGEVKVPGAVNLGKISDTDLIREYSNALFTLNPNLQEYFGYSIAESLACGTPVMAFNHGGAKDQIIDTFNGWLFVSKELLIRNAIDVFQNGYNQQIRKNARESSINFNKEMSADSLCHYISMLNPKNVSNHKRLPD